MQTINNRFIVIKSLNCDYFIPIDQIVRIQAEDKYVMIFTEQKISKLMCISMCEFINRYGKEIYIRIHRSHAININFVKAYNRIDETIQMIDGSIIPLARRMKQSFKQAFYQKF